MEAQLCPVYEVHDTHKIRSSAREFVWIARAGKRPTWRLYKGNFSLSSKAVSHFRWYKMCAPFYLGNLFEWAEQKAHGGVTHHWQNWSERWGGTSFFFKLLFFCPKMILIFVRGNAYKVQLYRLWYTCCYPPTLLTVTDIRHTYIHLGIHKYIHYTDIHTSRHTLSRPVCNITLLLSWLSLCQVLFLADVAHLSWGHQPKELSWQQVWPAPRRKTKLCVQQDVTEL